MVFLKIFLKSFISQTIKKHEKLPIAGQNVGPVLSYLPLRHPPLRATPGRRQSEMLLTINVRGSKISRNSVFDCHLSPVWQREKWQSKTLFLAIFYLRLSIVLTFFIAPYPV